jgi:antirestriction protein ArdC
MATDTNVYSRITRQIIEAMEAGAGEFRMPWHVTGEDGFSPVNAETLRPYRGVNCLCLWANATRRGFTTSFWATFRQWTRLGAKVRRGETASPVVFWQASEREQEEGEEAGERRRLLLVRDYPVFNAEQVDGFTPPPTPRLSPEARNASAEQFLRGSGARVEHRGDRAFYDPTGDRITIPSFGQFKDVPSYYSVLAHELTHWTGAKGRLDRDLASRFRQRAYAAEELVAELGAAFVLAHLKLVNEPRREHAQYLGGWLELLDSDPRAIFTAASRAQQALDYLIALNPSATRNAA